MAEFLFFPQKCVNILKGFPLFFIQGKYSMCTEYKELMDGTRSAFHAIQNQVSAQNDNSINERTWYRFVDQTTGSPMQVWSIIYEVHRFRGVKAKEKVCLEGEGASRQKVNSFSVLCCQKFRGQREGGGG